MLLRVLLRGGEGYRRNAKVVVPFLPSLLSIYISCQKREFRLPPQLELRNEMPTLQGWAVSGLGGKVEKGVVVRSRNGTLEKVKRKSAIKMIVSLTLLTFAMVKKLFPKYVFFRYYWYASRSIPSSTVV